jgi:hypothetical protein
MGWSAEKFRANAKAKATQRENAQRQGVSRGGTNNQRGVALYNGSQAMSLRDALAALDLAAMHHPPGLGIERVAPVQH